MGAYFVLESCTVSPLCNALMCRLCGSGIASGETRTGPMGAEPSKPASVSSLLHPSPSLLAGQDSPLE